MATYVYIKNGMGNYLTGTGAREDMLMKPINIYANESGITVSSDLVVSQRAAGANMSVDVAKGQCFVDNASYVANTANLTRFWGVLNDTIINLPISTNTSGLTRYDIIIFKVDTTAAPNDYATNVATIEVVEGTAGAGVPATPNNALKLCEIEIPDGTTTQIVDADITDTRPLAYLNLAKAIVPNNQRLYFYNSSDALSAFLQQDSSNNLIINNPDGHIIIQPPSGSYFYLQGTTPTQRIYNTGSSRYLEMYQDTNGRIRNVGGGDLILDAASLIVRTLGGNAFHVVDSGGTKSLQMSHNGTAALLTAPSGSGNLWANPAGSGAVFVIGNMPRRWESTTSGVASHIQRGSGFIQGDGTGDALTESVTFGVTYANDNVTVIPGHCGFDTSTPSDEGSFTLRESQNIVPLILNVTASGFDIYLTTDAATFNGSRYYGYSWIAIGPVA